MRVELRMALATLLLLFLLSAATRSLTHAQVVVDVIDLGKDGGGVAVNASTDRLYVAVPGQLNVYDTGTHTLVTTISLPQNYSACYDVAVNPVDNRIYAVGLRTYVVDGNSNTVLANLDAGGREVAVNPTTNRIYVGCTVSYPYTDPYVVRVLDGATNNWLPDIPLGSVGSFEYVHVAANPTTNRVYVAFSGDDELRVLNGNSHAEVARVHRENMGNVTVNPDTNQVYLGVSYTNVEILDGNTHASLGTIARIGTQLRLNRLTGRLYGVASTTPGYVLRIADLASGTIAGYIHLDGNLADYDIHASLGKLFATHSSSPTYWSKKMDVIQDASPASPAPLPTPPNVVAALDLPEKGDGVAVNAATNRLYVGVDGGVAVYDASTLAALAFVDLSSGSYKPPVYALGVDEALNHIYAVGVGQTWVIDGVNHKIVGTLAAGDEIAINARNGRVYIADRAVTLNVPDRLRIYDGTTLTHIRTIDLGTSIYYQWVDVTVNPTTDYAYCTYSLDDDLRIISPTTDDVVNTIDYASIGDVAVNPVSNRIYVWISRGGQSGALVLDGNSHGEIGLIQGISGQFAVNPQADRLYGYTGYTLFQIVDGTSGESRGRVFLDGQIRAYALHPGLMRLYATHHDYPAEWAKRLSVIQDAGGPPAATATPTATPVPVASPTATRPPAPDLAVARVWTDSLPAASGEETMIMAEVANLGGQPISALFWVGLYVDRSASGAPDAEVFLPSLLPSARQRVTFTWTFSPGLHALTVWADWNNSVDESSESNNMATLAVWALPRATPSDWVHLPLLMKQL